MSDVEEKFKERWKVDILGIGREMEHKYFSEGWSYHEN